MPRMRGRGRSNYWTPPGASSGNPTAQIFKLCPAVDGFPHSLHSNNAQSFRSDGGLKMKSLNMSVKQRLDVAIRQQESDLRRNPQYPDVLLCRRNHFWA